ncbi:MCE family protein [Lolliginicoccus levis]|uniref:MCE family protein n=1 Tax=Lolliginicoccus levis TaxID=2919542 RepID=UPI00241CEAE4|nr:MCE family protein [Lolliginicoccus levis]
MATLVISLAAVGTTTTGCMLEDGIYSLPLPGGADLGSDPINVTAEFDQVPEVFPDTMVKVNGVNVGMVDDVSLSDGGWNAIIEMRLRDGLQLPVNSLISIQQTALLGEKFVAIEPPESDRASEVIEDGHYIPPDNSRVQIEIEDLFGALSLLLNGGGVAQIQPILDELEKALGGREPQVKSLLQETNTLVNSLNNQRGEIQRALDNLEVMSARLDTQRDQISAIAEEIPRGTQILAEQTPQLIEALRQIEAMSTIGSDVITTVREDLVADLRALRPIVQALANTGADLPASLSILPTYPFPDSAIDVFYAGAVNGWVSVDLQLADTLENLGVGQPPPQYVAPYGQPQPVIDPSNPYVNGNGPVPGPGTAPLIPLGNLLPARAPAASPLGQFQELLDTLGVGQP